LMLSGSINGEVDCCDIVLYSGDDAYACSLLLSWFRPTSARIRSHRISYHHFMFNPNHFHGAGFLQMMVSYSTNLLILKVASRAIHLSQ
jgi:hypothetical protein